MNVAIIGGEGKMGSLVRQLLEKHGVKVFAIGKETKDWRHIIKKSDAILFSIPVVHFNDVIKNLHKKDLNGKLLIDLSSTVINNLKALKSLSPYPAFIHLLFGPDVHYIKNQNIAVSENITDKRFLEIVSVFKKEGAAVTEASPEHHDYMMGLVQALSQFNSLALAKTLSESRTNKKELDAFSSITFSLTAAAISRIMQQSPELWASIQFNNHFFKDELKRHLKNIETLAGYVEAKEYKAFATMFKNIGNFWKEESPAIFSEREPTRKGDKNAIGVLGPKGSYSHEASVGYAKDAQPLFFENIPEIINAVAAEKISRAIIPFENSIQGTVLETLDGIYRQHLKIIDDAVIDIKHSIAGIDRKISPKDVVYIYSHPQALGQCAYYLKKHYPHAKLMLTPSTSAAFRKIKDEGLSNALAIGPKLAADVYGLSVLEENIQNTRNNKTLFVVIAKKPLRESTLPYTLLVVNPKENRPGLLADILHIFKKSHTNLLKLESRPSQIKLGSYIFYLKAALPQNNRKMKDAARQLKKFGPTTLLT